MSKVLRRGFLGRATLGGAALVAGPSVVQRRCSLRNGAARHTAGYATLGAVLDSRGLAQLSGGRNLASRGHSREYPYRRAARHTGIYAKAGTRLRPRPRCSERRSPAQSCQRLTAINSQFLGETSRLSPVSPVCKWVNFPQRRALPTASSLDTSWLPSVHTCFADE
jgi:hypothetical protein